MRYCTIACVLVLGVVASLQAKRHRTAPPTSQPVTSPTIQPNATLADDPLLKLPATQPVPDATAIKGAFAVIEEVYSKELKSAKTPEQKKAVVRTLLDATKDEKGAGLYALLAKAKELAIDAGDVEGCDIALDRMGGVFNVVPLKQRAETYTAIARNLRSPDDRMRLSEDISATVRTALAADEFDIAQSDADLGLRIARMTNDPNLLKQATADMQAVRECEAAYADAKKAVLVLVDKPSDPEANLKVGKYFCLMKGDWKNGLPMLALGSDPALQALAKQETAGVTAVGEQVKLGDGWWDVGEKLTGTAQVHVQEHAARWYREALPNMGNGFAAMSVRQRVEKQEARARTGVGAPLGKITIVKAVYGTDKVHADATKQVAAAISDLGLIVSADNTIVGDSAPGAPKHLTVTGTFQGQPISQSVGERALLVWLYPMRVDRRGTVVVRALYGTGCIWKNVTPIVQAAVNRKDTALKITPESMGSPRGEGVCVVVFAVDGKTGWTSARNGKPLPLPLKPEGTE